MDIQLILMQLLSGAVLGAVLVMMALGFTIIFGMLGVVNFAHGALFMIGAYAGLAVAAETGSFWWALLVAPIAVGALGLLIERFLIRPLYHRPAEDSILLTFGLGYVLVEAVRIVFGNDGIPFSRPRRQHHLAHRPRDGDDLDVRPNGSHPVDQAAGPLRQGRSLGV